MRYWLTAACLFLGLVACGLELEDDWKASTLRPGDVLAVNVFRVAEFSKTVQIEEDGKFVYPLCGEIQAAGLTARTVAKELERQLSKQITEPVVDVYVERWAPRTVYILGEVKSSMSMELPNYGRVTALQAISAAGGFLETADLNNVAVLRRNPNNEKELLRIKIDVTALASKNTGGDDFLLRPEDTLIVPKAPPVYIAGAVRSPNMFFIDTQRPPLTSELIIRAGGMLNGADASRIVVVRQNGASRELLIGSLRSPTVGVYENDIRLQSGDYVLVASAAQIYVLGQVSKPGPLVLPPDKRVTASQAIALAGGFTAVAKQGSVTLIRDKEMQSLNLKKLYERPENLARDIELNDGDILFVQESYW